MYSICARTYMCKDERRSECCLRSVRLETVLLLRTLSWAEPSVCCFFFMCLRRRDRVNNKAHTIKRATDVSEYDDDTESSELIKISAHQRERAVLIGIKPPHHYTH